MCNQILYLSHPHLSIKGEYTFGCSFLFFDKTESKYHSYLNLYPNLTIRSEDVQVGALLEETLYFPLKHITNTITTNFGSFLFIF